MRSKDALRASDVVRHDENAFQTFILRSAFCVLTSWMRDAGRAECIPTVPHAVTALHPLATRH